MVERISDGEGRFFLPALRIGRWRVEARLAGLSTQTHEIVVEVGRTHTLELVLGVAGLTEQIEVQRTLPLLQIRPRKSVTSSRTAKSAVAAQRASLPRTCTTERLRRHPSRRDTRRSAAAGRSVAERRRPAIGPQHIPARWHEGHDELFNNLVINPSVDSIEEFEDSKSMYPAEFGGKASALINVVTVPARMRSRHGL